ncbi:MAG: hypothetical protein WCY93_07870 [Anaerolineaceae bacterium]
MSILTILNEFNLENGSNHKLKVLKKHKDNALLKRVFKLTYDGILYNYGLSWRRWHNTDLGDELGNMAGDIPLETFLDHLEFRLATREVTGNKAEEETHALLCQMSPEDQEVGLLILRRDLRISCGLTTVHKVHPGLVDKPVYMRCGIFSKETAKNIQFPAYIQLKADGTYREAHVSNGNVKFYSRSGEVYTYPVLEESLEKFPDGHYFGELVVRDSENRAVSNGLINSDNPPHDLIEFFVWDMVSEDEYRNARNKVANEEKYEDRFGNLLGLLEKEDSPNIYPIPYEKVDTVAEALEKVSGWMLAGHEGGILKDLYATFKNGTSKQQLKLKLEIDVDVRITGFQEGSPGTKREETFGAILFATDDGQIKGRTSGFTDAQLKDFNSRREQLVGKIMTVQANDLSRAGGSDHYALSHPRFIELREDRDDTDDLARVMEIRRMAMELS